MMYRCILCLILCLLLPMCKQRPGTGTTKSIAQTDTPVVDATYLVGERSAFESLQRAYPEHIREVSATEVIWIDGTRMPMHEQSYATARSVLENPTLADQLNVTYRKGVPPEGVLPTDDPGRVRYEPFFRKMYGNTRAAVEKNLTRIDWMPAIFGKGTYHLNVTRVNNVHKKVKQISDELEELVRVHPEHKEFLKDPAGGYNWRKIANSRRLSPHSFGIALDISPSKSHYWQEELKRSNIPVSEEAPVSYVNEIPLAIVLIFEKHGFIWGGKWYHYDTMHFEYRPELLV